jgi:hypothetical protein
MLTSFCHAALQNSPLCSSTEVIGIFLLPKYVYFIEDNPKSYFLGEGTFVDSVPESWHIKRDLKELSYKMDLALDDKHD